MKEDNFLDTIKDAAHTQWFILWKFFCDKSKKSFLLSSTLKCVSLVSLVCHHNFKKAAYRENEVPEWCHQREKPPGDLAIRSSEFGECPTQDKMNCFAEYTDLTFDYLCEICNM